MLERLAKRGRGAALISLGPCVVIALYLVHQLWAWDPYFQFYNGASVRAFLKFAATIVFSQPFDASQAVIVVRGGDAIIQEPQNDGLRHLLSEFPPPEIVRDPQKPFHERVTALREFVAEILPEKSPMPQSPEPVSALELLGENPQKAKYPRLCSKLVKIMVQYLSAVGYVSRVVQLDGHMALEVFNPRSNEWEMQDPFYNTWASFEGKPISAAKAHDLLLENKRIDYRAPQDSLRTVGFVPRNNFSQDHLPSWHYFNYDNLDYWRVLRVSDHTWDYWKRLHQINPAR
ncbi:MAG: hypothetical protein LDL07_08490 [Desulfarculus sp.]|nr:hypothetical protein [Desulfarculus sp.]